MIMVRSTIFACVLVFMTGQVYADNKWTITLSDVDTVEALNNLERMFGYRLVNPTAACLKQKVTLLDDAIWTSAEVSLFIKQVVNKAGCDVMFDSDKKYTLQALDS